MDRHVLPEFRERRLTVDSAVALKCTRMHVPDPRVERDALIAATTLVHRMAGVTGNVADFEVTGADVIDPWAGTRRLNSNCGNRANPGYWNLAVSLGTSRNWNWTQSGD